MKILIGHLHQECNTFNPLPTTMSAVGRQHSMHLGQDVFQSAEPQIRAALDVARAERVQCLPSLAVTLQSGGRFDADEFEKLKSMFLEQVRAALRADGPAQGACFSLHGAMVAQSYEDVEAELMRLVRDEIGPDAPITVSLDPHAHITPRFIDIIDGLVAYKTYPHVDQYEASASAFRMLLNIVRDGSRPHMAVEKLPLIVPAENSRSACGPYKDLLDDAAVGARRGDVIDTSIFPLQPWLDVSELGFTIVSVGNDPERAKREAVRLAELAWNKRREFDIELHTVDHAVERALGREPGAGPVVASFSADSPGAGSCGDGNFVLNRLLALGAHEKLTCLHDIVDAQAVDAAIRAGIGGKVETHVGHTISRDAGTPLAITGEVTRLSTGEFCVDQTGNMVSMGRAAVIQIGKVSLLVHEAPLTCTDPSFYLSIGLNPAMADLVVARSATQFRNEYTAIASYLCILDAPGFSTPDLKSLEFHCIERPFFPFEDEFEWRTHPHRSAG